MRLARRTSRRHGLGEDVADGGAELVAGVDLEAVIPDACRDIIGAGTPAWLVAAAPKELNVEMNPAPTLPSSSDSSSSPGLTLSEGTAMKPADLDLP